MKIIDWWSVCSAATTLFLLRYLSTSSTELDSLVLLIRLGTVFGLDFTLDFASHESKSILDIERALGGSLQETDIEVVSEVFGLRILHHSLILQVFLVADENAGNVFVGVFVDLTHPLGHFGERVSVGNVISHYDSMRPSVVA